MNQDKKSPYARASGPDVAARIRHAIEANETTRILVSDGLNSLAQALDHHLSHIDADLKELLADLEARPPAHKP